MSTTGAATAPQGTVVSPARAPKIPEGWTYRFTARGMGDARIDLYDQRNRLIASEPFAGHAQSPEFVLATACGRAHAKWQAAGGTVLEVAQHFTASASPEGTGWRVWCNQNLGVSFLVGDLEEAPALMVQALAQAKGLDPEDVRVTMVSQR